MSRALGVLVLALAASYGIARSQGVPTARDLAVPRYQHVFVIIEENKNYGQVIGNADAPEMTRLARAYGDATRFYAETHPSEPNYVALVGGYTYGLRDDDAFFCTPREQNPSCRNSNTAGYVDHTIDAPNLATQLRVVGLTWKDYLESIPAPGSLVAATQLYASKHSGFINFASVQRDPLRAQELVGFDQLSRDLASGDAPNLAFVVPNVCNEMHGAEARWAPYDCQFRHFGALVRRGDDEVARLVQAIMSSRVWGSADNVAIVVTFDENDAGTFDGCCGNDPSDPSNRGGGRIPTIVVTNHGPRHMSDATPYNHYSLLRTLEDAFGIHEYLQRAALPAVQPMLPLFAVSAGAAQPIR